MILVGESTKEYTKRVHRKASLIVRKMKKDRNQPSSVYGGVRLFFFNRTLFRQLFSKGGWAYNVKTLDELIAKVKWVYTYAADAVSEAEAIEELAVILLVIERLAKITKTKE